MKIYTGDIILIPFPFAELTNIKLRPAVVICKTSDVYQDIVVSAISSSIRIEPEETTMIIHPSKLNNLKIVSTILVDRIFTLKQENIIKNLGKLDDLELKLFIDKFKKLPENSLNSKIIYENE